MPAYLFVYVWPVIPFLFSQVSNINFYSLNLQSIAIRWGNEVDEFFYADCRCYLTFLPPAVSIFSSTISQWCLDVSNWRGWNNSPNTKLINSLHGIPNFRLEGIHLGLVSIIAAAFSTLFCKHIDVRKLMWVLVHWNRFSVMACHFNLYSFSILHSRLYSNI